jgi:hypothetical protein
VKEKDTRRQRGKGCRNTAGIERRREKKKEERDRFRNETIS